jgi:DNA polymerase-3 subunit epsilon
MNDTLKYAAIDLECATSDVGNICEIGLVIMENGKEIFSFRSLVRPVVPVFGDWQRWNLSYSLRDTLSAPSFSEVWSRVSDQIKGVPLIAHNASEVECKHLGHAFSHHQMQDESAAPFYCTLELARKAWPDIEKHGIKSLARLFDWELDHHNPESDARVCSAVVERIASENGTQSWDELVAKNQWQRHSIPQFQNRLIVRAKHASPKKRSDYIQDLITWKPTLKLDTMAKGQSYVISGFDNAQKQELRMRGSKAGLMNRRSVNPRVDFLVADEKMGAAKYGRCLEYKIPIISKEEFLSQLPALENE